MRRTLALQTDSYTIPAKRPCRPTRSELADVPRDPYALHRRELYPVPAGWRVEMPGGQELTLAPGEERDITVKITATDGFHGTQAINVNALDGAALVGGVTLYVHD
jgi:hypothetical protein